MRRFVCIAILATAGIAFAKPTFSTKTIGKVSVSVPEGYKVEVGKRCIAWRISGNYLTAIRTTANDEAFERYAKNRGRRLTSSKASCFVSDKPSEHGICLVTTAAGRWVATFTMYGKGYTELGGAEAIQTLVESVRGWSGKPYDGLWPDDEYCPDAW